VLPTLALRFGRFTPPDAVQLPFDTTHAGAVSPQ
jgi:hypothetical protein